MPGTTPRRRLSAGARRVREHCVLALISAALIMAMFRIVPFNSTNGNSNGIFRWSIATAYASLALLVTSLVIGPLNVLRSRPNPVSTNLRRDVGIWAGAIGLAHVVFGLQVHLRGRMLQYFFDPKRAGLKIPLRIDRFGAANYTGLVAGLLLLLLLTISNDVSLRTLGKPRWKLLQRLNYFAMGFTVLHGIFYQWVEDQKPGFIAVFAIQILIAIGFQVAGYRAVRSSGAT
ncbi:MAG: hypothetical protein ACREPM_04180 [Gemmatimonadaceae bacterium]